MKKIILLILLLSFMNSFMAAQSKGLGVGLMLGEPSGLSANYWLSDKNAVDFHFGFSPFEFGNRISLHADYLHHHNDLINSKLNLNIYYGFGTRFRFKSGQEGSFGIRGVVGTIWNDESLPLDVFFEIAPVFRLFPSTGIDFDVSIGARWYFEEFEKL